MKSVLVFWGAEQTMPPPPHPSLHFGPFDPRGTFLVSSQCQACISHAFGWPFKLNSYCCSCLLSYCKMLFWKPWIKLLCVVVFQPWIFSLEGSFNQGLNLQLGFYYGRFSSDSTSPGKGSVPSSSIWKMIAILFWLIVAMGLCVCAPFAGTSFKDVARDWLSLQMRTY